MGVLNNLALIHKIFESRKNERHIVIVKSNSISKILDLKDGLYFVPYTEVDMDGVPVGEDWSNWAISGLIQVSHKDNGTVRVFDFATTEEYIFYESTKKCKSWRGYLSVDVALQFGIGEGGTEGQILTKKSGFGAEWKNK